MSNFSPKLILASTSPYRLAQLRSFGLDPIPCSPKADEEAHKNKKSKPRELAPFLAQLKAESLEHDFPQDIIVGGDQIVAFEGKALGKGGTPEGACAQLLELQGKSHELISSICMIFKKEVVIHTTVMVAKMRTLSENQIRAYVLHNQTWDAAGSYKIEKSGWALFESFEGEDPSSIMGIPLMGLTDQLLQWDFELPFFRGESIQLKPA